MQPTNDFNIDSLQLFVWQERLREHEGALKRGISHPAYRAGLEKRCQYFRSSIENMQAKRLGENAAIEEAKAIEESANIIMPEACPDCGTGLLFSDIDDMIEFEECSEHCGFRRNLYQHFRDGSKQDLKSVR